jgi:hypothetical protein
MSLKWVVRVAVVVLAAVLVVWIARHVYWDEVKLPAPLRGEALRNPFYATQRFAEALGATTAWDRELRLPSTDAVIVVALLNWDLSDSRRERLERWVEAGGRLVVDLSLLTGSDAFERWSGISRVYDEDSKEQRKRAAAEQQGLFPEVFEDDPCRELVEEDETRAGGNLEPVRYSLCDADIASSLESHRSVSWAVRDEERSKTQALRVELGSGSVTLVNATPFLYLGVLEADHAELFVAGTQLRSGDEIRFLSEQDQASLLALTWRFGAPAVVLLAVLIALALWRGVVRFGPVAPVPAGARRSLAEQILGTGRFALRVGGGEALHAAALRALRDAAVRRIAAYDRLSPQERVARLASATRLDGSALAAALDGRRAHATRRASGIAEALAMLEEARRRILIEGVKRGHGN